MSADQRRAGRRELLIQAVLDVVLTEGVAGVTVDRVCASAQLTKRYFYESFGDLDTILVSAVDELLEAMRTRMDQDFREHPLGPERTHAIVSTLIDSLADDPRFARLYAECPGHPALRLRQEEAISVFTEFVLEHMLPEPRVAYPMEHRRLAARLLVAGTTELVTSWLSGRIDTDRDSMIASIERVGLGV